MNKKLFSQFLALAFCLAANAQYSAYELFQQSAKSIDLSKGVKTSITIKMVGIGETIDAQTDGKDFKLTHGNDPEVIYINDSTVYEVDHKEKAIEISDDLSIKEMFNMPLVMINKIETADKEKFNQTAKVSKEKEGYVVTIASDGPKMIMVFDATTFQVKSMRMKKGFITLMSVTYSKFQPFTDLASLKFDPTKYPSYKVKDTRKKK